MTGDRRSWPRRLGWLAAWLIVSALVIVAARSLDWRRTLVLLSTAQPGWIAAALVANTLILVLWACYWRFLLPAGEPRVTFPRMFEVVSTASALMNTVPFGAGHASSLVLLAKRGGTSSQGALSVLALDQLGEGIIKVGVFLAAGLLVPLPGWMRAGVDTVVIAVLVLFTTMIVVSYVFAHRGRMPAAGRSLPQRVLRFVAGWAHGLDALRRWPHAAGALVSVAGMKAAEALAIVAVQRAFGVHAAPAETLLVLAALLLATMVSLAPGNLGTYEASVFLAYRYFGVPADRALGLAIMQHLCFILPAVGVGYLIVTIQTLRRSAMASR